MKQHREDLRAAFRIGAESVTAIARIRYCPDCLPRVRKPLTLRLLRRDLVNRAVAVVADV